MAAARPPAGAVARPAATRYPGRLRFAGLGYAILVLITGTNLPTPLYPLYVRVFGLSTLDVTTLVAMYAAAVTVSLVICGPLSDTIGYRPVLTAGLATAGAGAALLAAASGPAWLLAGRAVQGLAVGACSGALTAGLDLTEPAGRRDRASLVAAVTTTAAVGAGPVLSGALAQFAPAPRVLPYLVEIGLLLPALVAVLALPAGLGAATGRWRPRWPRLPASRRRDFAAAAALAFLGWAVAYVVLALIPSYAAAATGASGPLPDGAAAGSLLLVAAASQLALRGWPAGRSQRAGAAFLVAGLGTLLAAGALGSGPLLFAAMAVAGAGLGTGFAGAIQTVNGLAPAAERAGTFALFYVITYVGAGAATVGVGLLSTIVSLTTSVAAFAAVFAAAGLGWLAWGRAARQ